MVAGATGALGVALAIGMNTTGQKDAAVWVPGVPDDNAQYQTPDDDRDDSDDRGDDDEQRTLPPTPHVSTAQPGEQHAQSNGS